MSWLACIHTIQLYGCALPCAAELVAPGLAQLTASEGATGFASDGKGGVTTGTLDAANAWTVPRRAPTELGAALGAVRGHEPLFRQALPVGYTCAASAAATFASLPSDYAARGCALRAQAVHGNRVRGRHLLSEGWHSCPAMHL